MIFRLLYLIMIFDRILRHFMRYKQFKVLTFDLDDTLWECLPVIEKADIKLRTWLETHYPKITSKYTNDAFFDYRTNIVNNHPEYAHDFSFIRQTQLLNIALDSGYTQNIAEKVRDLGFEVFITERSNVELYDDVIPSFKILCKYFRLGALTNGNVDLSKTDLNSYFNFTLNAVTAGCAKPDSRFFQHACNLANVEASEILHIGDHPIHDINGAIQAGLKTVWLNRNNKKWPDLPKPDNIIYSLNELPDLLLNN